MDYQDFISKLKELNQDLIIEKFNQVSDQEKKDFIAQFNNIDKIISGIGDYIKRAKVLLTQAKNNENPFSEFTPEIPQGSHLEIGSEQFYECDRLGFPEIENTIFALVAGGLGERLGYPDIKINIQTDLLTKRTYIELYTEYIKAFEDRIKKIKKDKIKEGWYIPLFIMTSDETDEKTRKLLKDNKNFDLKDDQITIIKQEKYPALMDNECHLALMKDKFLIETKPHGHGDVHNLLYKNDHFKKLVKEENKKYLVLFQDTNALSFNCIPSAIGSSVKYDFDINSICVPRKPKDAIGVICKLNRKDGTSITNNVEYNQLDALLKEKYNKEGDVANKDGYSDFPGNINIIVFKLSTYMKILDSTQGLIPEFVNPKYTDETRTKFKSPTRLECLMQDLPKILTSGEKVGFTSYPRWFCFSACKNNLKDACDKLKKGQTPESAFSVEQDIFICNNNILEKVLGKLEIEDKGTTDEIVLNECKISFKPKIVIYPSFAPTISHLKDKLSNMKGGIKMTKNSSLILKNDVKVEEAIKLDGNFILEKDEKMVECQNKEYKTYIPLKEGEGEIYEKIRGYHIQK